MVVASASTEWILPVLTTAAVMGLTALPLLQSDAVSRIVLKPNNLQAKRLQTYQYIWDKEMRKHILWTVREMGGDENLELLVHDGEINDFITKSLEMCTSEESTGPKLLCIGVDDELATREVCVWIALDWRLYQVSLKKFGLLLADRMENIMTTTALCFVADASGGVGTDLITNVLQETNDLLRVPVVREPTWLAQFASLVEDSSIQRQTLERCLFGLVRLEAHAIITKTIKTVCITLPGQATTAPLLPLLHAVFPCERHVFIYDGCGAVVNRALAKRSTGMPQSMRLFESPIRHTTPLRRTLSKQIPTLAGSLKALPLAYADTTECWMTSVDAMLQLKEDTLPITKKNAAPAAQKEEYLPFVCKLSLLLSTGTSTERQLALLNLMQFMTGSRSRSLPDGAYPQASVVVSNNQYHMNNTVSDTTMSPTLKNAMEDAVFRHKSILLGDKTLVDTVLPTKEWSLKSTKKISGCACCGPEDDDEDEDEYDPSTFNDDSIMANLLGDDNSKIAAKQAATYVDGKAAFAFDPTKFV